MEYNPKQFVFYCMHNTIRCLNKVHETCIKQAFIYPQISFLYKNIEKLSVLTILI